MVACIECGSQLSAPADVMYGEVLDCPSCGVELVITNSETMEMRVVESTDEDWGE